MWPTVRAEGMGAIYLLWSTCPRGIHQSIAAPPPATLSKPSCREQGTEMQLLGIERRASNSFKGKLKWFKGQPLNP